VYRVVQVFLLCLGYLLLECGDAVGLQSFLTKIPYVIGTVDLRVCDCVMCLEKRSKTLKDTTDVEDSMTGFVSNT
jgi:hypothetical protein